jgi:hypothetical protein
MQSARYQLAVVVLIALLTGLLYSQVCDLNCTFYGCRLPQGATEQSDQTGHCHEQQPQPAPSEPDNSKPDCPSHSELSALISSTIISVGAFNLSLHAAMPPSSVDTAILSTDVLLVRLDQIPFRAPPTHSILRI